MKEKTEIIFLRESFIQSLMSDIVTFGSLAGMFYFNYRFLGDSVVIQIIIGVMLLVTSFSRSNKQIKRFDSREDLINYL